MMKIRFNTQSFYFGILLTGLLLGLFFLSACKDDTISPDVPVIVIGEVTDIETDGATFHGRIINEGSGISELGFVWDESGTPGYASSRKVVPEEKGIRHFNARISADHQAGREYAIKAYLKTGEKFTFSNAVKFTSKGSQPPEITDFSPKNGLRNTEVTIYGKNFSYVETNNQVKFGEIAMPVTVSTDSTITVKIPQNVYASGTVKITVSVLGKSITSTDSFELGGVIIESFTPKTTSCSGTVTIKGNNFRIGQGTSVRFRHKYNSGEYEYAQILAHTDTTISVKVPVRKYGIQDVYHIEVQSDWYVAVSADEFILSNPQINSVSKSILMPYDTLVIRGAYFGKITYVILGEHWLDSFKQIEDKITVVYPPILAEGSYELKLVNECYHSGTYSEKISVKSPWVVHKNIPMPPRSNAVCIALGDMLYVGLGTDKSLSEKQLLTDFWEFNTVTEQWTRKADFPGLPRDFEDYCEHDGKIIVGPGYPYHPNDLPDFWQYDPATDTWEQFANFHLQPRAGGQLYSIDSRLYFGLSITEDLINIDTDFYWYDEVNDIWQYLQKFDYSFSAARIQFTCTFDNKGLFVDGGSHGWPPNWIYTLNPSAGGWHSEGYTDMNVLQVFNDENDILFVSPYSNSHLFQDLYFVDPSSWMMGKMLPSFEMQGDRSEYFGAISNDRLFIGLGTGPNGYYNDMIYLDLNDYR